MCGIYGILNSGRADTDYRDAIADMSLVGAVRGVDGMGMFQIDEGKKKDDLIIYDGKVELMSPLILTDAPLSGIIHDANKCLLTVGHHRAKTTGEVNVDCTQPFSVRRDDGTFFAGVHNGTLTKWTPMENGEKFFTDSHWAINKLSENYDEALAKKIRGAYTFVTYDSAKPRELIISRDGARPMHFCFVKGQPCMFFASEADMLVWILGRHNISIEDNKIYECQAMSKYVFDADDPRNYVTTKIVQDFSDAVRRTPVVDRTRAAWDHTGWRGSLPRNNSQNRGRARASSGAAGGPSLVEMMVTRVLRESIYRVKEGNKSTTPVIEVVKDVPVADIKKPRLIYNTEEAQRLKEMGFELGEPATFVATVHDPKSYALYGTAVTKTKNGDVECHEAIMRDVTPIQAQAYIQMSAEEDVSTYLGGAFLRAAKDKKGGIDIVLVLCQPIEAEKERIRLALNAKQMKLAGVDVAEMR